MVLKVGQASSLSILIIRKLEAYATHPGQQSGAPGQPSPTEPNPMEPSPTEPNPMRRGSPQTPHALIPRQTRFSANATRCLPVAITPNRRSEFSVERSKLDVQAFLHGTTVTPVIRPFVIPQVGQASSLSMLTIRKLEAYATQ